MPTPKQYDEAEKALRRKAVYRTHCEPHLDAIRSMARGGLCREEIAKALGVGERTFYRWTAKHADLKEALEIPSKLADFEVEAALRKVALGYEFTETSVTINEDGTKRVTTTKKLYPPNVTAMIFWLKNRQPERWRDRQEHTGADGGPIQVETDDAKSRLADLIVRRLGNPAEQGGDSPGD